MNKTSTFFVFLATVSLSAALFASDWPQYRGPAGDGVCTESVNVNFASNPKAVWKVPTRNGFSSFAIAGGKVYTQVSRDGREVLVALDAKNGKELWSADLDAGKYPSGGDAGAKDNNGGDGPRSTPTISDGLVYAATPNLLFYCFNADTGKPVWKHDLMGEFNGRNIQWKSAQSPVIDGDLMFVAGGGAGQSLIAFDKKTGKVAWKSQDETITHSTAVVATILGQKQVIYYVKSGLVSVAADSGRTLWKFPMEFKISTAISPVVSGDIVYASAGYGVGGAACKISKQGDRFGAKELWRIPGDKEVANHWSTPVARDGYLYGMFCFKEYGKGPLKCVEIATGKVKWEKPGFGQGNLILVNDKLLALSDDGHIVSIEAAPSAYREIARAKAVTGKCWSTPAISDGKLYVRSTKEGVCIDLGSK